MLKFKKKLGAWLFAFSPFLFINNAHAVAYQIFPYFNYGNPASLSLIKKGELIIGDTTLIVNRKFNGSVGKRHGTATSNTTTYLPYGRAAARLGSKVVVGVDVTEPGFANFRFPINSILAKSTTDTVIGIVDISPKLSIQLMDKLAWGVGFNANDLFRSELNFVLPPRGELRNTGTNWAYGWNTGLLYTPRLGTMINLSYYSKILHHITNGVSTWGSITKHHAKSTLPLPALYMLNLTQFINPKWAMLATVRYAQWDLLRFLVLQNTAIGTINIPLHYKNGWGVFLGTRYQFAEKWRALGSISFDDNIVSTIYRGPGLAVYSSLVPSIGAEYALNKQVSLKLLYSHAFAYPPINTPSIAGPVVGHINSNANAIDLSLTWDF